MLSLTIRTDKPEAEIGLFQDATKIDYETWLAHRELAETIHLKIDELLKKNQKTLENLGGIVVYQGPGSFTGLRIGISVANALADGLEIPIVAGIGDEWLEMALDRLAKGENDKMVIPEYGALPNITKPKH
jgi:tRNA threonylcarbamoyladenosine biosynthesis protein TsaB